MYICVYVFTKTKKPKILFPKQKRKERNVLRHMQFFCRVFPKVSRMHIKLERREEGCRADGSNITVGKVAAGRPIIFLYIIFQRNTKQEMHINTWSFGS